MSCCFCGIFKPNGNISAKHSTRKQSEFQLLMVASFKHRWILLLILPCSYVMISYIIISPPLQQLPL
ncbi:hypothetical protein SNEBB_002922 [Seison nebaliae]|nr:hypothetical protein SNEBB_002922 [Seison nebaliae]